MSNRKIRVVKRDAAAVPSVPAPKPVVKSEQAATSVVKTWVTERRQNENAEKRASGRQIFAWKHFPEAPGEPA